MDDVEEILARAWLKALAPGGIAPQEAPQARCLLRALIVDLLAALYADRFDASAGVQVGRALVAAQWTDEQVPRASARVLHRLADHCPHPDVTARLAELFSALGQGHQAGLCDLRGLDHSHTVPGREAESGGRDGWFRMVFDNIAAAVTCRASGHTHPGALRTSWSLLRFLANLLVGMSGGSR